MRDRKHPVNSCLKLGCAAYDKLSAEKQAQAERIAELEKYERFYQHIESHLTAHQVVICKICGKSLLEVEQVLKGETPAAPKEKRCEQR